MVTHTLKFYDEVAAFAHKHPPAEHQRGVVLVGSSIARLWADVAEHLAPLPVINLGFGGCRTWEVLANVDLLVHVYNPKVVIYYCGSNDVNFYAHKEHPDEAAVAKIATHVRRFRDAVHRVDPAVRIVFLSIIRAPQKEDHWDVVDDANTHIERMCAQDPITLRFVDLHGVLEDAPRVPKLQLYLPDRLHYTRPAYEAFRAVVRPVVLQLWEQLALARAPTARL